MFDHLADKAEKKIDQLLAELQTMNKHLVFISAKLCEMDKRNDGNANGA